MSVQLIKNLLLFREAFGTSATLWEVYKRLRFGSPGDRYQYWMRVNEPTERALCAQRKKVFEYAPKISLLVSTVCADEAYLDSMVRSVLAQTYGGWELCLTASEAAAESLSGCAATDERVKLKKIDSKKSRAEMLNVSLGRSTGEFVAVLGAGDELAPFALFEMVRYLNCCGAADIVYSDEDVITGDGERRDPAFKPGWSPEYFLSTDYIGSLTAVRKTMVEEAGGFRRGFEGAEDFDMRLRATELTESIAHIPKVLYHRRAVKGSAEEVADVHAGREQALSDTLKRRGIKARLEYAHPGGPYRIKHKITGAAKVSVIIPTRDKVEVLRTCVASITEKTSYRDYEILIVDNRSQEAGTFAYYDELKGNKKIKVLRYDKPFNYSAVNNYAVSHAQGKYLLFLNNDTEVITPDWLESMIEYAQQSAIGVVGAKLQYPDGTIQHAGIIVGIAGMAGHAHRYAKADLPGYGARLAAVNNFSAVTGACMMMRKEVFEEAGGFDENYAVAFNDVDLCVKITELGYRAVYTPYAELYHHECLSRGRDDTAEKLARFKKEHGRFLEKWGHVFKDGDPFYNPNLTLTAEDFSIRI